MFVVYWIVFELLCFCSTNGQSSTHADTSSVLKESTTDDPRPPIFLIPGLVSSRLVAWKKKACRGQDINVQDIVWLNLQKLVETMTYDQHCWLDCMKLGRNGTDPTDCKVRPDEGLSAIGELSPGNIYTPPATSIFTSLIKMLAGDLGYDVNNILGLPYDWRLAPVDLENRDSFFTILKFKIETAVKRHRRPAIIMAHSMGANTFMYFCDWLRYKDKPSMGWEKWIRRHIWAFVGFSAPLLGSAGALKSVLSGHTFGLTISDAQARELELTFPSTHFLNPRSSQGTFGGADFTDPLVFVQSVSGGSSVSFGVQDIENGEIFRWMGNMYQEPAMLSKYESLKELYDKDPLKPLKRLYKRPPIKHVIMVYGVDIPTEIGYSYLMADNTRSPILDEVIYEEPCAQGRMPHMGDTGKSKKAGSTSSTETPSGIQIQPEMCRFEDDSLVNSKDFSKSAVIKDVCSKLPAYSADVSSVEMIASVSTSSNITGSNNLNANVEAAMGTISGNESKSLISSNYSTGESSNPSVDTDSSYPSMTSATSPSSSVALEKCVPKINAVKSKGKGQKRFMKTSDFEHTGDFTVPYLSLSYAKTWLNGTNTDHWEEYRPAVPHRHILDSWAPLKMTSAIKTYDPPVEIFYSSNRKNGDTTCVMEFSGIDHLDMAKSSFVHALIFESLLPKMAIELCVSRNQSCEPLHSYGTSNGGGGGGSSAAGGATSSMSSLWADALGYFEKIRGGPPADNGDS